MARIVHFELLADDPERAVGFWTQAFGWRAPTAEGQVYWPVFTGTDAAGIDGGIMRREDFARAGGPSHVAGAVCTVQVDALDAALAGVERAGGRVLVPGRAVPGVGRVAYCADTEGNAFGVLEPESAEP
jgi:predicted enzyme related to lactoylglutathione lyase